MSERLAWQLKRPDRIQIQELAILALTRAVAEHRETDATSECLKRVTCAHHTQIHTSSDAENPQDHTSFSESS